jgi:hypothetical protein
MGDINMQMYMGDINTQKYVGDINMQMYVDARTYTNIYMMRDNSISLFLFPYYIMKGKYHGHITVL